MNQPTTQPSLSNREIKIKRLTYRSWYRGCKETDQILGKFADTHLTSLSDQELDIYETFLDEFDQDIWLWLTEKEAPSNPAYLPLLHRMAR